MSSILDSDDENAETPAFCERFCPDMARPIEERMRDGFCCASRPMFEDVWRARD